MAARASSQAAGTLLEEWSSRSTDELLDFILERFHAPLREALEQLDAQVARLRRAPSSDRAPELMDLACAFDTLRAELLGHMTKEERVLFPWIRRGEGHTAGAPIAMMLREHRGAQACLAEVERLADALECHPEDCPTLPGLVSGLRRLRRDLERHMALEDQVLFPRALQR